MTNGDGNDAGDRDDAEGASGARRLSAPPDDVRAPRLAFPVVGIGASAGGLEAYTEFLQATPVDAGMAYVLVQHLPPDRESMLVELLARRTQMPVLEVVDGQAIAPDHVYVIRPGHTLTIKEGHLWVGPELAARGHGRPIDDFFRSLAEEQQQRAVAVVFSGTGSDGSAGAQVIKAVGGLVIAQEPESAKYPSMPRSLIDGHLADLILRPAEVPEAVVKYARHPYVAADGGGTTTQTDEQALADVLTVLRTRTRHDFSGYRKPTLFRRVRRRMGLCQIASMGEYVRTLRQTPAEVTALADDLLIHVTGFFRDPDAWAVLREKVIDPLVQSRADGTEIRCWVSACATGEEAYTLAMLLVEAAEAARKRFDVKVFATDMAERALGSARSGVFPNGIESEVTPERLARFFDKDDAFYRVKRELRELVIFAPQNILQDPPFSRLDIATCRNLLIYLEPETQRRVLALLHFGLREGGALLLGSSESAAPVDGDFEPIDRRHRLFRRVGPTRSGSLDVLALKAAAREARPIVLPVGRPPSPPVLGQLVSRALLDRFTPVAVAVDAAGQVVHVHGDTARYLTLPPGGPTHDLLALANDNVRGAVRTALRRAIDAQAAVTVRDGLIDTPEGRRRVEVGATPLGPRGSAPLYLLTFCEHPEVPAAPAVPEGDSTAAQRVADELQRARNELQGALEEMQSSNEELKASHEEATSLNEELQSTNEELETSKEEMQSLNEELVTVNAQLQAKMSELEDTANDLGSLLTSTDIAVLFLDLRFRIRRFTPAVKDLLDLIPGDVGRPFLDLRRKFVDEALMADAQAVLDRLIPIERAIESDSGRAYLRRILPYRTQDNRIDGVVVAFVDVTELREAERALGASREELAVEVSALARLHEASTRLWRSADLHSGLQEILDATMALLGADTGHVQLLNPTTGMLEIVAQRGLSPEFLAFFREVSSEHDSACGRSLRSGSRIVIHDVEEDAAFASMREVAAAEGYRAVQSTPLLDRDGTPLGILSTHFRRPHRPSEPELRRLDLFVRQAVDFIARQRREAERAAEAERDAFRVKLADTLRPLADPAQAWRVACRVLGEHLGVDRALYCEVTPDGGTLEIPDCYARGDVPPLVGRIRAADFSPATAKLRRGEPVVVANATELDDAERAVYGAAGLAATITVPLLKHGRWTATLAVQQCEPRAWTVVEVALVEEAAERTWAAVERARAEAALRASEERLQMTLAAAETGTFVWFPQEDRSECDHQMLALFGLPPDGRLTLAEAMATMIHPSDRAGYGAALADAMKPDGSGELRADLRVIRPDGTQRWLALTSRAEFAGDPPRAVRMPGVAMDVTDRKRIEEGHAFLLELGDALRPLADPVAIEVEATRVLGEHLAVDRTLYAEAEADEDHILIHRDFTAAGTASIAGRQKLSAFGAYWVEGYRAGRTLATSDFRNVDGSLAAAFEAIGVRACIGVPVHKGGKLVGVLMIHSTTPREWTPLEVALVEATAERTWAAVERAKAEAALRASEARLRAVAANLPNGAAFVVGHDLRYTLAEGQALVAARFSSAQFEGKTLAEALPADLAAQYEPRYRRALAGEPFREEHTAHGRQFVTHGEPLRDAAGQVTAVLAVSYDITDLRWAEERLRLALAAARMGIWTLDLDTGTQMRDANLNRLLGLDPVETTQPFAEFLDHIHPDDRALVSAAFAESLRDAKPLSVEFRVVQPDGAVRWLRDQGDVFGDAAAGRRQMAGACVDVTERRAAEEAVRSGEERLRLILASATDYAIFTLADDRTITSWSSGAAVTFGYSDAEILGQPADVLFTPEDRVAGVPEQEYDAARRAGRAEDERWHLRKDGGRFYASGVLTRLASGEFVKVARDLTGRKRMEDELRDARDQLEERVTERTAELAAAVSSLEAEIDRRRELALRLSSAQEDERKRVSRDLHDTVGQTHVALLMSLAAATRAVPSDSGAAGQLAHATRLADSMGRELHDVAVRLRPTALDDLGLTAALNGLVHTWSRQQQTQVELQADLDDRLPDEVETALYRLVQEALTNVARHARATTVSVTVSRQPGLVTAVVEDDGAGFDPASADATRLGLRGMRERVMLIGGELVVESSPGVGTSIIARVPLHR